MRTVGLAMVLLAFAGAAASTGLGAEPRKAPDLAGGGPWFNTSGKALTLPDLRGKVVAVEMWTAG